MAKINVLQKEITILKISDDDFISLTDIAKFKSDDPGAVIANWMRNRNTLEYLGLWETLYNPGFKHLEFDGFRAEAGLNAFTPSPQKSVGATDEKAVFVNDKMPQHERLIRLNKIAIHQMQILQEVENRNLLK